MAGYTNVAGVNDQHEFPPDVRSKLAASVELAASIRSVTGTNLFRPESYADLSNLATIAGPAVQLAINAAVAAGGGTVVLSNRVYKMGTTTLIIPATHYYTPGPSGGVQVDIVGAGIHSTRLQWDTDLGAGKYAISCGDPTANNTNKLGRYASGVTGSFMGVLRDLSIEGPGQSGALGTATTLMSGFAWGARRSMKNVNIRGFWAGLDIVGDNATFENVATNECYYAAYWNEQSNYYYGDLIFTKCFIGGARMAAIGLHPLSQGIKGTRFDGCYISGAPYGIMLESDSVTTFPFITGDVIFDNCMFEGVGNALFYDDNFANGTGTMKGILGGISWRNSLFAWNDSLLLTTGGRSRQGIFVVGQVAGVRIDGIRNASQLIPGSLGVFVANQFKGMSISTDMDVLWAACVTAGLPFIKSPGGGGFSANTIQFEKPGYYKGTFLPQINGGSAVAVGSLVERSANRFDRADASTTGANIGVALMATTGGTSQSMTPIATSGENVSVLLSGSGLANSWLKKGTAGVATAATGPTDGTIVGWLKSSSGSTGSMALLPTNGPGSSGGGNAVSSDAALHTLLGISASPAHSSGTLSPIAGRTDYVKVPVAGGSVLNSVVLDVATAGAGITSAYVGVYSAAGNLLAQSADIGGALAAIGNYTAALTSSANVPSGDTFVFIGVLVTAATTLPVFRGSSNGLSQIAVNFGIAASSGYRSFYTTASGQTSLPATVAYATGTQSNKVLLLGVK